METEPSPQLSSCTLNSVAKAVDAFQEKKGLLVCHIRRSTFSNLVPIFSVPQGYYALVQRGGKFADFGETDNPTWPPGMHFGILKRVTHLVAKQSMVYNCKIKQCITRDNIPTSIRATLVLRVMGDPERGEDPAVVRKFVHELGVRGLETQLSNAMAEAIRVMARATPHKAVYALGSGGGVGHTRCRHPKNPSPASTASTPTCIVSESTKGMGEAAREGERMRRGSVKRIKVAPDPDASDSESVAWPSSTTAHPATTGRRRSDPASKTAGVNTTTGISHVQKQVSPLTASPSPLPVIQRGLRASRIVPVADAEAAAQGLTRRPTEDGSGWPAASFIDDRRRVYPTEAVFVDDRGRLHPSEDLMSIGGRGEGKNPGGGYDGGNGGDDFRRNAEEIAKPRIPSRPPPPVTSLDLSLSPNAVSSASSLPPLELGVATLPSLSPTTLSPANGRLMSAPNDDHEKMDKPSGDGDGSGDDSNRQEREVTRAQGDAANNDIVSTRREDGMGGATGSQVYSAERRASSVAEEAAAAAAAAADQENNGLLGHQHAGEVKDRLNRTFRPQGVEISAVMIRSTELPSHVAEQMSGKTLNISIAEEQRAVKRSESQRVRHDGEVLELRQRCEIERALAMREADREVEKAKERLRQLRAQADATLRSIAVESASAVQLLAAEGQRDVSRSVLKESAGSEKKGCASDRAAGIVEAEAVAFQARRESESHLEVVQNFARARGLIDTAEGIGAPMLRAARTHYTMNKRLQVLESLASNDLALVVTSPLLAATPPAGREIGSPTTATAAGTTTATSLGPRQVVDALTAFLLGEAGFRGQVLEEMDEASLPRLPPRLPQRLPPQLPPRNALATTTTTTKTKTKTKTTRSSPSPTASPEASKLPQPRPASTCSSRVVRRRRMELGVQLALARFLGSSTGRGGGRRDGGYDPSSSYSLPFAVGLSLRPEAVAMAASCTRTIDEGPGASHDNNGRGVESRGGNGESGEGDSGGTNNTGENLIGEVDREIQEASTPPAGKREKGRKSPGSKKIIRGASGGSGGGGSGSGSGSGGDGRGSGGGGAGGSGGGGMVGSIDDCELCILRDGLPFRLLCSV